jgi:hypothetical protein
MREQNKDLLEIPEPQYQSKQISKAAKNGSVWDMKLRTEADSLRRCVRQLGAMQDGNDPPV